VSTELLVHLLRGRVALVARIAKHLRIRQHPSASVSIRQHTSVHIFFEVARIAKHVRVI
jgi:hypothetical protein